MDALVFAEFCERLTEQLQQDEARASGKLSEIIPMDKLGDGPGGPDGDDNGNLNRSSTGSIDKAPIPDSPLNDSPLNNRGEDDLLRGLGDGNYVQPRKESDIY